MIKKLAFLLLLNLLITIPSKAAEVTNIEWTVLKDIQVTLYNPNSTSRIECTALYVPEENKPIGGGSGLTVGAVAQVRIDVPPSYEKKGLLDFKIICQKR